MVSNSKIIFVSSVAIILASASGIPSTIPLLSQSPVAEAQELSGDITRHQDQTHLEEKEWEQSHSIQMVT